MIKCKYCDKLTDAYNCIPFCNEECLNNYVIVQIFTAKQALEKEYTR